MVLYAAGYNLCWLLRMIVKKGLAFWIGLFLRLRAASGSKLDWAKWLIYGRSFGAWWQSSWLGLA